MAMPTVVVPDLRETRRVRLWDGYDDHTDRGALVARLHDQLGDTWQVETVDNDVATVVNGTPSSRPLAREVALGDKAGRGSGADISALADDAGRTLVVFDYPRRRVVTAAVPPAERALRDRLAAHLKVDP